MKKIAILIPCFNEETTIAKVVWDFKTCMPDADIYVYVKKIGCMTADDDGTVTFSFTVDKDLPAGIHPVTLTGDVSGSITATFEVTYEAEAPTGGTSVGSPALGLYGILAAVIVMSAGVWVGTQRRSTNVR